MTISAADEADILDWAQLRTEILQRRDGATPVGRAHWERILTLVDARLDSASDTASYLTDGSPWWLAEVQIAGFRGISESLALDLDPSCGLTIVHAPNGAGKSTIADAVRTALWGSPASQPRALWQSVDRAAGASRALIEVVLRRGTETLRCVWSDEPEPCSSATVTFDGTDRSVPLTDPDWQAALAAFTPVFSYGETQDRLGSAKDLANHLEDLLALGPCFALLKQDVDTCATTSREAAAALKVLRQTAQAGVEQVDKRFATGDPDTDLVAIAFPARVTRPTPDAWLTDNGLTGDLVVTAFSVSDDVEGIAIQCADDVVTQLDHLTACELDLDDHLDSRLRTHLTGLHGELEPSPPPGPCPVCGSPVDWWTPLTTSVHRLGAWSAAREQVTAAARELQDLHNDQIAPLVRAADDLGIDINGALRRPPGDGRSEDSRSHLRTMADVLRAPAFAELAAQVRAHGDHRRHWVAARSGAVDEFVQAWRSDGPAAVTTTEWTQAAKNLTILRNQLRDVRGTVLGKELGAVLHRLLVDAHLTLDELTFRGGDAVRLKGGDETPRSLGMLSAGQRNALVLAPLLRAHAGGPFGFVVVDDPVHAFDDMRIDLVSDELVRLAADRRVIVLTHDSRLTDALKAKFPDTDMRTLRRQGVQVVVEQAVQPWVSLVEHAQELVELGDQADLPPGLGRLPVVVRGMCRHAIDGALRELAQRWAVLADADLTSTVAALDKAGLTGKRLTHARRFELPGRPSPADEARGLCEGYLRSWNSASHDTGGSTTAGLAAEVSAAQKACKVLDMWGRP